MAVAKDKWDAGDYARNSSAQELWANELISKLALQGNEFLLDIGCNDCVRGDLFCDCQHCACCLPGDRCFAAALHDFGRGTDM